MSKEAKFMIYCIETYKNEKSLNGKQVIGLLKRYDILNYIMSCYGALHTTGGRYIVEDIELFIKARQAV